jgi:hypothetical protein
MENPMTLSRWKMVAGVLGLSLGGLAAVGAQCPKTDASKGSKSSDMPMLPDMPAAKAPPAPAAPPAPIPAPLPDLPVMPQVKTPEAKLPEVKLPDAPPVIPASGLEPKQALPVPDKNPTAPVLPPDPKPSLPGSGPPSGFDPAVKPSLPPAPLLPSEGSPRLTPPPEGTIPPPPITQGDPLIGTPSPVVRPTPAAPAVANKFRILLRVGEGEPTFEVHCGDDLVLKVVCEKVDIKSPEKGNGPSAVKASGKVRFAGFGAEGICDELSFFAGNGEVSMTGSVKIHVKDKLGRVESELSTESIRYKLDPCPTGFTKP